MNNLYCEFTPQVSQTIVSPAVTNGTSRGKTTMPDKKIRLLIAEDTKATRNLLFAALDASDYSIDFAINGREAIEMYRNQRYDIVITDLQMPIVDGLKATREIRRFEKNANRDRTPIVALTAGASQVSRETCIAAGMDDYLSKPIDLVQLTATIKRLANQQRLHTSPETANKEGVAAMTSSMTLNVDEALARLQGNNALFNSMAKFFIEDRAGLLAEINSGVQDDDHQRIAQGAHALKGLAASVGGEAVVAVSHEIELLAKNHHVSEVASLLPTLEIEIEKLLQALSDHNK